MKIGFWILGILVIATPITLYFWQRLRQSRAEKKGVVVYATVVSIEPVKVFGKYSEMMKITMWLQEPGGERREVSLRSRIAAGQEIKPGVMLAVVVDPNDPKRIYPAGEEASKRIVLTGPRRERRQMQSGRGVQRPGVRPGHRVGGRGPGSNGRRG
jgi:uncharacterized membrane protein